MKVSPQRHQNLRGNVLIVQADAEQNGLNYLQQAFNYFVGAHLDGTSPGWMVDGRRQKGPDLVYIVGEKSHYNMLEIMQTELCVKWLPIPSIVH